MKQLTPTTDYTKLLKDEYGVDIPKGVPIFNREYAYMKCVEHDKNGISMQDIRKFAIEYLAYFEKYPWIN